MCAWVTVVLVVLIFAGTFGAILHEDHYEPLSPEEEKRWLMEDCGLTEEEADDIMSPIKRQ